MTERWNVMVYKVRFNPVFKKSDYITWAGHFDIFHHGFLRRWGHGGPWTGICIGKNFNLPKHNPMEGMARMKKSMLE